MTRRKRGQNKGTKTTFPPFPLIWAGSYTAETGGSGGGLTPLRQSEDGSLNIAGPSHPLMSPSFVAVHPSLPVLYTADESAGTVSALRMSTNTTLTALGASHPAGEAVCHIAVDPLGRFVVAACWGDGAVVLYELLADGSIGARFPAPAALDQPDGTSVPIDPHTQLSRRSRAHCTLILDEQSLVTTDLGFDLLRFWRYSPAGLLLEHELSLPPGCGPRHLTRLPDGRILVVTEYSVEVVVVELGSGEPTHIISTIVSAMAGGIEPGDSAAEIALSEDGKTVYVGVRGRNRIAVLRVGADIDGRADIRRVADFPSGGQVPRHHLVRGNHLWVAHQGSGDVCTHQLDIATGTPVRVISRLKIGSPTALSPISLRSGEPSLRAG